MGGKRLIHKNKGCLTLRSRELVWEDQPSGSKGHERELTIFWVACFGKCPLGPVQSNRFPVPWSLWPPSLLADARRSTSGLRGHSPHLERAHGLISGYIYGGCSKFLCVETAILRE